MPDKYKDGEDYVFSYPYISVSSEICSSEKNSKYFWFRYLFLLCVIACVTASQPIWHYYYTVKKSDLFTDAGAWEINIYLENGK